MAEEIINIQMAGILFLNGSRTLMCIDNAPNIRTKIIDAAGRTKIG